MRIKPVLALFVLVGCAEEDAIRLGDVKAIDNGTNAIAVTACLDDEGFLSCGQSATPLEVVHAGVTTPMPYAGLIFPNHRATIELRDRGEDIVVLDGAAQARMRLPPAFELAKTQTDDQITITWTAAGVPMLWEMNYSCGDGGGFVAGDEIDDNGSVTIELDRLRDGVDHPDPASCAISVELSRVLPGTIDHSFPASYPTGIARRSITVQVRSSAAPQ